MEEKWSRPDLRFQELRRLRRGTMCLSSAAKWKDKGQQGGYLIRGLKVLDPSPNLGERWEDEDIFPAFIVDPASDPGDVYGHGGLVTVLTSSGRLVKMSGSATVAVEREADR